MEDNKQPFKITTNHIGDYLVFKTKLVRKTYFKGFPLIVEAETGARDANEIYAVMQIRFHNEGVRDVNYKINLRPVGIYRSIVSDRNWYTCDVEHHIDNNTEEKCFDDPIDALNYAAELNKKLYPEPKLPWYKRIKNLFIKKDE